MNMLGAIYVADDGEVLGVSVTPRTAAIMGLTLEPLLPYRPRGTRTRKEVFSRLTDGKEVVLTSSLPWTYALGTTVTIDGDDYIVTRQLDERGVFEGT